MRFIDKRVCNGKYGGVPSQRRVWSEYTMEDFRREGEIWTPLLARTLATLSPKNLHYPVFISQKAYGWASVRLVRTRFYAHFKERHLSYANGSRSC
jgi:hypothetical protein